MITIPKTEYEVIRYDKNIPDRDNEDSEFSNDESSSESDSDPIEWLK